MKERKLFLCCELKNVVGFQFTQEDSLFITHLSPVKESFLNLTVQNINH